MTQTESGIFILTIISLVISISEGTADKVFCYYEEIAATRTGNGRVTPTDLDPTLCTHLIYAFLEINGTSGEIEMLHNTSKSNIQDFLNLRKKSPQPKFLISIGGSAKETYEFNHVIANDSLRTNFLTSLLDFLKEFPFDGIDIYIEAPGDKNIFVTFLRELRSKIPKPVLVTMLLSPQVLDTYDIHKMNKFIDYFILKTYDFHTADDFYLGYNAPLNPGPADVTTYLKIRNINFCLLTWTSALVSLGSDETMIIKNKMILGIPVFGRSYLLTNPLNHNVGSLSKGKGHPGPYSRMEGYFTYLEVCERITHDDFVVDLDKNQTARFAYNSIEWISYDDAEMAKIKIELAFNRQLGGVAVFPISNDDSNKVCSTSDSKFPITTTVKKTMEFLVLEALNKFN